MSSQARILTALSSLTVALSGVLLGPPGIANASVGESIGAHRAIDVTGMSYARRSTETMPPSAQLTLVKEVVGGSNPASDWILTADGTGDNDLSGAGPVVSGQVSVPDSFTLSESGPGGYTVSPWSCTSGILDGDVLTIQANDPVTCTITNVGATTTTSPAPSILPPTTSPPTILPETTSPPTILPETTSPPTILTSPATSTSTAPSSEPETSDPGEELSEVRLRECRKRASEAFVVYEPLREMKVDEETTVVVSVFLPVQPPPTQSEDPDAPATTIVAAELSCKVKAELDGGEDFAISPDEPQPGSFARSPEIRWQWDVTPLSSGTLDLVLRITPILSGEGADFEDTPLPYEQTILVKAENRSILETANDGLEGFVDYPLVRGAGSLTMFFALLAAAWHWILRRPWPWAKSIAVGDGIDSSDPGGHL